ncbi:MAG: glycosyltransferase, partial [Candidatus Omnitrophica bacterium]|nr:glycosyltransferase [Candidatus Omnitrophota bacterium]
MPIASIIITTKNEEANIANCLQSIKTQTYPQDKIEIIVVDNNSQDKTKEIALTFTDKVYNHGHERSAQRNFGMINIAKGKYVMFVDGDMVLSEELIEEAVNSMESNSNLVGLYVPLRWVGDNWIIKGKGFEREFYDASCLDAVRFIKREIIVKIGGFDERLYAAEDWDLDKRIRQEGKVTSIRSIMYHYEDKAVNLKEHLQKNQYYLKNI